MVLLPKLKRCGGRGASALPVTYLRTAFGMSRLLIRDARGVNCRMASTSVGGGDRCQRS